MGQCLTLEPVILGCLPIESRASGGASRGGESYSLVLRRQAGDSNRIKVDFATSLGSITVADCKGPALISRG